MQERDQSGSDMNNKHERSLSDVMGNPSDLAYWSSVDEVAMYQRISRDTRRIASQLTSPEKSGLSDTTVQNIYTDIRNSRVYRWGQRLLPVLVGASGVAIPFAAYAAGGTSSADSHGGMQWHGQRAAEQAPIQTPAIVSARTDITPTLPGPTQPVTTISGEKTDTWPGTIVSTDPDATVIVRDGITFTLGTTSYPGGKVEIHPGDVIYGDSEVDELAKVVLPQPFANMYVFRDGVPIATWDSRMVASTGEITPTGGIKLTNEPTGIAIMVVDGTVCLVYTDDDQGHQNGYVVQQCDGDGNGVINEPSDVVEKVALETVPGYTKRIDSEDLYVFDPKTNTLRVVGGDTKRVWTLNTGPDKKLGGGNDSLSGELQTEQLAQDDDEGGTVCQYPDGHVTEVLESNHLKNESQMVTEYTRDDTNGTIQVVRYISLGAVEHIGAISCRVTTDEKGSPVLNLDLVSRGHDDTNPGDTTVIKDGIIWHVTVDNQRFRIFLPVLDK